MNLPEPRILVVDDEPMVRDSLRMVLASCGYSAECASSAEEALTKFDSCHFDAVITDHSMPGMKGQDLALAIKSRSSQSPVIMLTGAPPSNPLQGVDHILLKPFTLEGVRTLLSKLLVS